MSGSAFSGAFSSAYGATCRGWLTVDEARDDWREAPYDDAYLQRLLNVAAQQVVAWGPKRIRLAIESTGCVPEHYLQAQLMQTRDLWNAQKTDPNGAQGAEPGFAFTPFPMDWTVKAVIRPPQAKPVVR